MADNISVSNSNVTIVSNHFIAPSSLFKSKHGDAHYCNYIIMADTWSGIYSQYDLSSDLWPLVPERTFKKISELYTPDNLSLDKNRVRVVESIGNGLNGIAALNPALVNPKFGISTYENSGLGKKICLIGRCEHVQNNYWLFDLNDHGALRRKQNKDYALFAFVAPMTLSEEDKIKLANFVGKDDIYVKGVKEGWSILFLGYDQEYYILPGICPKSDLIKLIPDSIRNRSDGIVYYNIDETLLFG